MLKIAGWILSVWGAVVAVKGVFDIFILNPESYFVPMETWINRWAPFEIIYGTACIVAGILFFEHNKRKIKQVGR